MADERRMTRGYKCGEKKGPSTKNIPFSRIGWRPRNFLLCVELADKLHLQYNKPIPTASRQELRLLTFAEIRNAIDELYVARSQYQAGGLEPEKCSLINSWPVWDLAVYVPTGDYPDLSHKLLISIQLQNPGKKEQ